MAKRVRAYEDWLLERLKDPEEAAAYLRAHLERDPEDSDELYLSLLKLAVEDVCKALENK